MLWQVFFKEKFLIIIFNRFIKRIASLRLVYMAAAAAIATGNVIDSMILALSLFYNNVFLYFEYSTRWLFINSNYFLP